MKLGQIYIDKPVNEVFDVLISLEKLKEYLRQLEIEQNLKIKMVPAKDTVSLFEGCEIKFHISEQNHSNRKINYKVVIEKVTPNEKLVFSNQPLLKKKKKMTDESFNQIRRVLSHQYSIELSELNSGCVLLTHQEYLGKSRTMKVVFWLMGLHEKITRKNLKRLTGFLNSQD